MAESFRFSSSARRGGLVAVLLLGILVATALAEGFVRLRQWAKYGTATSYDSLYKIDEASGLPTLVPGARVGKITINASGFRGPEIEMPKPPGRVRLAFIGASTTFCAEVSSDAAAWPDLVVERLHGRFPGTRFDYVNGGVPGYAVRESIVNLQHRIDRARSGCRDHLPRHERLERRSQSACGRSGFGGGGHRRPGCL